MADFDESGIWVYQAYSARIADYALQHVRFGGDFKLSRMSWIKPSWGWMLYRSSYASLPGQERILKIKLGHESFQYILKLSVPSSFDSRQFQTHEEWKHALMNSDVRFQWDPDRNLALQRLDRRALQIGMSGETLARYAREWCLCILDVTGDARNIQRSLAGDAASHALIPGKEREYPLDSELRRHLGIG